MCFLLQFFKSCFAGTRRCHGQLTLAKYVHIHVVIGILVFVCVIFAVPHEAIDANSMNVRKQRMFYGVDVKWQPRVPW